MNKGGKSGERDDNVRFLAARIGNRSLVAKQGALCAGTFNNSLGVNVSTFDIIDENKHLAQSSMSLG